MFWQLDEMHYQPKELTIIGLSMRPILEIITCIIPTLGQPILVERLWIVNGSAWPGGLVVVDQGQNERVVKVRGLGIDAVYVRSKQQGKVAVINIGIQQVKTKYFALTDDVCC